MKMSSWRVGIFALLALAALIAHVRAAPEPPDPLAGDWFYFKGHPVTFNADGTARWKGRGGFSGTWEYLRNPEVQRHYRIVWDHGRSIDLLTLAEDGQRAHVYNDTGEHRQYDVRRAISDQPAATGTAAPVAVAATPAVTTGPADPDDPIIGDWTWGKNRQGTYRLATFKANGTATLSGTRGTWQYLHNLEAARKYVVTWGGGKSVDTLTYEPRALSGRVMSNWGDEYEVTHSAPVAPAAADRPAATVNPFGTAGH